MDGFVKYKIPFISPSFPSTQQITEDYERIINLNWYTNFGPYEQQLSDKAGDYISPQIHATTVANATLGIQAAVKALFDVPQSKREVIVASFTFAAGPEVLIAEGYTPVLIDVDHGSWQPSLQAALNYLKHNKQKVAGVLLTNTFGVGNKEIGLWEDLAAEYQLPIIVDSAAGFGSYYSNNEKVGTRGDCEIFSFHATKPFAVGEGGLISSKDPKLITKLRQIQNFGFDETKNIKFIGMNAKLSEFSCAIGLRQLEEFDIRLEARRRTLKTYKELLEPLGFEFQNNDSFSTVPFASVLVPRGINTDAVIHLLGESGIECRRYYAPLHAQSLIKKHSIVVGELDITNDIYSRIIAIPVHDSMKRADIDYVYTHIKKAFHEQKASR